jgi:hypothetical protein
MSPEAGCSALILRAGLSMRLKNVRKSFSIWQVLAGRMPLLVAINWADVIADRKHG